MNTIDAIKTRRSCRKYKPQQVEDEKLVKILEAGTYAPTGHNTQEPWIVAVQNPKLLKRLRRMNLHFWNIQTGKLPEDTPLPEDPEEEEMTAEEAAAVASEAVESARSVESNNIDTYYGAPTIVLVFAEKENVNAVKDGSLVLGTMMLAAHELGVGTCWINREDKMFETAQGKRLMKRFGLPEDLVGVGALALGYWNTIPRDAKPRKKDYFRIIK